jgi:flagellar protein FlaG
MNIDTIKNQPAGITPTPLKKDNIVRPVELSGEAEVSAATTAATAKAKKPEYSENELQQAVTKLNDFVQNTQRNIQFSVDEVSGILVTKVIDSKSEKVIRQIPTEETIKLANNLTALEQDAPFNIFSSRA